MRGKRIITMVHMLLNMKLPTTDIYGRRRAVDYINGHKYNPTELVTRPQMRGQQHGQHDPESDCEGALARGISGSKATDA